LITQTDVAKKIYPHVKILQSQFQNFDSLTKSLNEEDETKITLYYDALLSSALIAELTYFMNKKISFLDASLA